ncbi:MAG TPA: CxxxxCH/CxxCH domain-containing protein [Myxococcales bacterium]|nr:CxxxxCH/CxxCH domain-containing protein [Myxococcales bacterium]
MKPDRRLLTYSLAILAGAALACGGNDHPTPPDSGNGVDSGTPDAGVPDSGIDAGFDAGHIEPFDGGNDAGIDAGVDAGEDAGIDAGEDGGTDAGEDGGIDAGTDGGTDGGVDAGPLDCSTCHTVATLTTPAHDVHIAGGTSSSPFPCSECHTLYTSAHPGTPVINFATEAGDIANKGGLSPTWTAATTSCSSVYCHGGDGTSGGKVPSPNWTIVDGSQARCDSCHGNPPPVTANPASPHVQCTADFCFICHLDGNPYMANSIDATNKQLHINGVVDVMPVDSWGTIAHGTDTPPPNHPATDLNTCNACHGSPPVGNAPTEKMSCGLNGTVGTCHSLD